ncbi:redoxin domain-containing protein [Pelagicoccus sp. NFK12]|uniref:Redoxin domain-containing protein n=1 Tax=Pelagicoccus enzymogenes TaxID=2773457 RepID=A0A927IG35_9BACT|nr:redoxin domain-containing protein [Pelagicoccus enzymogenes]MBD5777960.1 redoxin domain-containing protein [Pelagicoccus enzymogenes]
MSSKCGIIVLILAALARQACLWADPPPFPLGLDGGEVDVFADAEARALVCFFVEENCPISNRYVPRMKALASDWSQAGVTFYTVYPSMDTTSESVRLHRKEYDLEIPALIDREHVLVSRSQASVTPECSVFARKENGEFELVYHGRIDDQYLAFGKWRRAPLQHDLRDTLIDICQGRPPAFRTEQAVGCYISKD